MMIVGSPVAIDGVCYAFDVETTSICLPADHEECQSVVTPSNASLSYPILVAGNTDGSPTNNGGFRSSINGWLVRAHESREGRTAFVLFSRITLVLKKKHFIDYHVIALFCNNRYWQLLIQAPSPARVVTIIVPNVFSNDPCSITIIGDHGFPIMASTFNQIISPNSFSQFGFQCWSGFTTMWLTAESYETIDESSWIRRCSYMVMLYLWQFVQLSIT